MVCTREAVLRSGRGCTPGRPLTHGGYRGRDLSRTALRAWEGHGGLSPVAAIAAGGSGQRLSPCFP